MATQLKNFEKMVKKTAKKFEEGNISIKEILESIRDPLMVVDLDGNILSVNQAFKDWYAYRGISISEYIGKPCFELPVYSPGDIGKHMGMMKEVIEKGHAGPIEVRSVFKDGHEEYQSVITSVVKDAKGEPVALVTVFRDITETKKLISELSDFREATIYMLSDLDKTNRELVESKEYIENIVRSMIDTLIVITPEGNIRTVNEATLNLLGYRESELIGQSAAILFAEEEEEEEEELVFKGTRMAKLIKEGSVKDYALTYRTKSGEKIPISFSGSVMYETRSGKEVIGHSSLVSGGDGEQQQTNQSQIANLKSKMPIVGIAGIARDMREMKRFIEKEKEVAAAAAAAAERKKTDKLKRTEQALRQAYEDLKEMQKELIRSEKLSAVGELAAGIAHEIRNPLGNIHASAQYSIKKFELNEQLREHLNVMLRNSQRANKIIKDLLDFAKPREVSLKLGHIGDVIDSACHLVKTRCSKQHIRLTRRCSGKLPPVLLDEKRLEGAFLNFILNALDAMPGGGKLVITASLDSPKNDIVVRFSDTGKGISQENLNKIFDPFFTTKEDGTGLGLSLAHRVIDFHKGKINIESKVGKGTEVIVRLPMDFEKEVKDEKRW